jgi:hypothetical protein
MWVYAGNPNGSAMTLGSKNDYCRNHAGVVPNTLYSGGNPKLEAGVCCRSKNL